MNNKKIARKKYSEKVWRTEMEQPKNIKTTFLSDYYIDPRINKYDNLDKNFFKLKNETARQYFFTDSKELITLIKNFHISKGLPKGSFEIFESDGSTPMITTMILFARELGFKKIYSISPVYFNIHRICNSIGTEIVPCNNNLTHEEKYVLNLPRKKSFLFLTDPIWIIGRHHSKYLFIKLKEWQKKTKSLIFLDSSFDYTDWSNINKSNLTNMLDHNYTFRLYCPTKSTGLHGVRFAYLICPKKYYPNLNTLTFSTLGSTNYLCTGLKKRIFKKMVNSKISPMAAFAEERFNRLKKILEEKKIDFIHPECGVYLFAKIAPFFKNNKRLKDYSWLNQIGMDVPFEEYRGYSKINLVMRNSKFNKLLEDIKNGKK